MNYTRTGLSFEQQAELCLEQKAEIERLNSVIDERIADINTILDDNEAHRAMKLATDIAFMEQRKQLEKYRQALNRVLAFTNGCPRQNNLTDGIKECSFEGSSTNLSVECAKCWKIALGVDDDD